MKDITVNEIQNITREVNQLKFPYLESYAILNKLILEKAESGEDSISFDFVDTTPKEDDSLEEIRRNYNRIYLKGGQALFDVYDFPRYLIARGFSIEIRKSMKSHGYASKSYYVSWKI